MEPALKVKVSTSVVVRSVICVVDSLVAMVVTQLLITMVGMLVVRTALLDSNAETAAEVVVEELVVGASITVDVRYEISRVGELVVVVVTWVLVVMTGRVSDPVSVIELSTAFDDDSAGEGGPLKRPLDEAAPEDAETDSDALEDDALHVPVPTPEKLDGMIPRDVAFNEALGQPNGDRVGAGDFEDNTPEDELGVEKPDDGNLEDSGSLGLSQMLAH